MINFKSTSVPPRYDYYVETDLDNFDDQPIDFSKKYQELPYDECLSSETTVDKSSSFSTCLTDSRPLKQSCNDEVKVYCFEGTPLIISSASSICDLRDVDINDEHSNNKKDKVSLTETKEFILKDDSCNIQNKAVYDEDYDISSKLTSQVKDNSLLKEIKVEDANETPLMFSRCSSIESLNSFEQHSFIDDRSPASMLSTQTSGLISPSELPDSPGDLMSPALSKEQQEFSFSSNESENKSIHLNDIKLEEGSVNENILLEEEKQEIVNNETIEKKNDSDSDDPESEALLAACIKQGMPQTSCEEKRFSLSKQEFHLTKNAENDKDSNDQSNLSDTNSDVLSLKQNQIQQRSNLHLYHEESNEITNNSTLNKYCNDSDEDSDSDALLAECIKQGMPQQSYENRNQIFSNYKRNGFQQVQDTQSKINESNYMNNLNVSTFLKESGISKLMQSQVSHISSTVQTNSSHLNKPSIKNNMNNSLSDSEDSESEALLKECIKQGMPKTTYKSKQSLVSLPSVESFQDNNAHNNFGIIYQAETNMDTLVKECIKLGMPTESNHMNPTKIHTKPSSKNETNPADHYEIDYDNDPSMDALLEECIKQGMPKALSHTSLSSSTSKNFSYTKKDSTCYQDGVCNDDSDDELIEKCIQAGMPKQTKRNNDQKQNSLPLNNLTYLTPDNSISICKTFDKKLANSPLNYEHPPINANTTWISNSSYIDVDSMRIYRTEDTPTLSPFASLSDLSSLSFNEDKSYNESYRNNSRNSDCSSDSDSDELLQECIKSGMPGSKRAASQNN